MSAWLRDPHRLGEDEGRTGTTGLLGAEDEGHTPPVTEAGAAWLASAGPYPRSPLPHGAGEAAAPVVLPCGTVFDVVSVPAVFGRRMLDRLWSQGIGSGPVAAYRGRLFFFAAPGTAQRLPSLLSWEEWGGPGTKGHADAIPPLLFHGCGDAVTVPPPVAGGAPGPRWLVAPRDRRPWLPGPDILLWASVRVARAAARATGSAAPAGRSAGSGHTCAAGLSRHA